MKLKKLILVFTIFGSAGSAGEGSKVFSCGASALARTDCLIRAVLDDVKVTYKEIGGGGISEIKMLATDIIRVSVSHEEKVDHLTYDFESLPGGRWRISKRASSSNSMGN